MFYGLHCTSSTTSFEPQMNHLLCISRNIDRKIELLNLKKEIACKELDFLLEYWLQIRVKFLFIS